MASTRHDVDDDLPPPPSAPGNVKLQRWVDVIAALLDRRAPVTFEALARDVPAYGRAIAQAQTMDESARRTRTESVKRTFERDKDELRALGIVIDSHADADGNSAGAYTLRPRDFYLPYLSIAAQDGSVQAGTREDRYGYRTLASLTLDSAELAAIVDAAAVVRTLGDPLLTADIDRALRKLAVDLPLDSVSTSAEPSVVLPRARPSNAVFEVLSDGLHRRKLTTFQYHALTTDQYETRTVEPWGLFFLQGHWYLVARDRTRSELRNFRLNRISKPKCNALKPASADFEIPETFRLRDHAASRSAWELGDGATIAASVRVRGASGPDLAAAKLGERIGDDDSHRTFTVRRIDAFVRWLLSTAGGLVPITPDVVVHSYRQSIHDVATLYAPERTAPSATLSTKVRSPARGAASEPWQPKGAAAQLQRILQLVPAIADEGEHAIDAVAAQLGTDVETVQRDVFSLVERYDAPGGFVESVQLYLEAGRLSARSNHFLRPMRLTASELSALALGLTVLRRRRALDEQETIDAARSKLLTMIARLPDDPIPLLPHAVAPEESVSASVLDTLRHALQKRRSVSIGYRSSGDTKVGTRAIRVYALAIFNGMHYAVAFCEREQALRIFRLDRVESVQPRDAEYEIPPDFSLDAHIRDGRLFHGRIDRTVIVRYSPVVARWIAEREAITPDADGSIVVEYPLADDEWAMRHVLQYGAEAEILAPVALRGVLRARLDAMLAATPHA